MVNSASLSALHTTTLNVQHPRVRIVCTAFQGSGIPTEPWLSQGSRGSCVISRQAIAGSAGAQGRAGHGLSIPLSRAIRLRSYSRATSDASGVSAARYSTVSVMCTISQRLRATGPEVLVRVLLALGAWSAELDGARRPRPATAPACGQGFRCAGTPCSACSAEPSCGLVLVLFGLEGFADAVFEESAAQGVEVSCWPVDAVAVGRLAVIDLFCAGFGVLDSHARRGLTVVKPV
jgi:hypothetical protein